VPWHAVTDGTTFLLRNNTTGKCIELPYPFSPESLTSGDFATSSSGSGAGPASFTELRELLRGTRSLILDHTIPLSAFGAASLLRRESSQWVRDELESRFTVRTVIEFGNVFPDVHPAIRFCAIQLGTTPGQAYLASITGDVGKELGARCSRRPAVLRRREATDGFRRRCEGALGG
jgi:hypothetical protein